MSAALNRFFTLREQLLLGGIALAIVVGAGVIFWSSQDEASERIVVSETNVSVPEQRIDLPPEPTNPAAATQPPPSGTPLLPRPEIIGVAVRGAVAHPGLYYFDPGSRVDDLVKTAGGFTEMADDTDINIGAHLIDATTLTIPAYLPDGSRTLAINPPAYTVSGQRGSMLAGTAGTASATGPTGGLVNINTAAQSELETLPGIGPSFAARIVEYRQHQPFQRIDDLLFISGIAEKRFAAIRDLVTVN